MRPVNRYQMMHFDDTVEGNYISMIQVSSQHIMKKYESTESLQSKEPGETKIVETRN